MKSLILSFLLFGNSYAWQPADRAALKSVIDACVPDANADGSECYACADGTHKTSSTASCDDDSTPQFISDWDTSLVTDMNSLFRQKKAFNQDISGWNTAEVTNMYLMFNQAEAFDKSIGDWNTASVTTMEKMFSYTNDFNQNINDWDVSAVTDFTSMFQNSNFNQPLDKWDIGAADLSVMFHQNPKFNQDISSWDTSSVTDMYGVFESASSFNQDLSCWDISSTFRTEVMFRNSALDKTLCWDISGVTHTNYMFTSTTGSVNATCTAACTADGEACSADSDCISGACDTTCQPRCEENEHVSGGSCQACAAGKVRAAGDDPAAGNTACETVPAKCSTLTCPTGFQAKTEDNDCAAGTCTVEDTGTCCDPLPPAWTQLGDDIDGEAAGDESGSSVSVSADGKIIAIGAPGNDANAASSGHVRVYQYTNDAWTQMGDDIDGDSSWDKSGTSVSLSSDGSIVAIGAELDDDGGYNAGQVRVYEYSNGDWTQLGDNIDGEAGDKSGISVSLSADGTILAIGAHSHDSRGTVRVYEYSSGEWTQIGDDIDGEADSDSSGRSVSLSDDGTRLAIGANGNDGTASNAGHVRVYEYSNDAWEQLGDDIDGEYSGDGFGIRCSLNADGTVVAVGAYKSFGDQYTGATDSGQVRVYQYSNNAWTQLGDEINGEAMHDQLGYSGVSLSSDGLTLAFGAWKHDNSRGTTYVYKYSNNAWTQIGDDIDGEAENDFSGLGLAISRDGATVVIGAWYNDGTSGDDNDKRGHVRVYTVPCTESCGTGTACVYNGQCTAGNCDSGTCQAPASSDSSDSSSESSESSFTPAKIKCSTIPNNFCERKGKTDKDANTECAGTRCTHAECCQDIAATTCQATIDANNAFCTKKGFNNKATLSNTCTSYPCTINECCDKPTRGCKTGTACNADDTLDVHVESMCYTCQSGSTCSNKECDCPPNVGGRDCSVNLNNLNKLVKNIRSDNNVKATRQTKFKELSQSVIKAKVNQGISLKNAMRNYRLDISRDDLTDAQKAVITKNPRIAQAPENTDQDDTCHLGPACGTHDLQDDADDNKQTIVHTGEEAGSWTVIVDGNDILSKQTKNTDGSYDMQCWDTDKWEAAIVKQEGDTYECHGRVLYVGSQVGICGTDTCQNGGTCAASGTSFTCVCPISWTGTLCDEPNTSGNDGSSQTCQDAYDNVDKIAYQNLNCACKTTC